MATVDPDKLRAELTEIGARREAHKEATSELLADTGKAIKKAVGVLSMTEVAGLLGLERTAMYHTYLRG